MDEDDNPPRTLKEKWQERVNLAAWHIARQQHKDFIALISEETNCALKGLSIQHEIHFEDEYRALIPAAESLMEDSPGITLADAMFMLWPCADKMRAPLPPRYSALRNDIIKVLTCAGLSADNSIVELVELDILFDMAPRLGKKILLHYLRERGAPEAAIARLYPSPGTLGKLIEAWDEPFLYPDVVGKTEEAPAPSKASILVFPTPRKN